VRKEVYVKSFDGSTTKEKTTQEAKRWMTDTVYMSEKGCEGLD